MRPLLVGVFAFLLWSGASAYWYLCKVQGTWCPDGEIPAQVDETKISPPEIGRKLAFLDEIGDTVDLFSAPIAFKQGSSSPRLPADSLLEQMGERIMLHLAQDSLAYLMISGLYDPFQEGDSLIPAEVVGAERAIKLKALLAGLGLDPILIETEIGEEALDFSSDSLSWTAFEFAYLRDPEEAPLPESLKEKQLIFFSYAKPLLQSEPQANAYIEAAAAYLRQAPSKQIRVVGYTDDTASKGANYRLGMKRAVVIRDMLIAAGVSESQILAESLGEADPIGNNNSMEGRAKNRRVEMEIIY